MNEGWLVIDFLQKKAAGRSGRASHGTVSGRENSGEFLNWALALSHFDERTGNDSDHLAKKTVAGKSERPTIGASELGKAAGLPEGANPSAPIDSAFITGSSAFKTGVIVAADNDIQPGVQALQGKGAGQMCSIQAGCGELESSGKKIVAIGLAKGAEAAVEIWRRFFRTPDTDVSGEHRIQAFEESDHRHGCFSVEMGDHAEGVDTGIGPACTVHGDGLAAEDRQLFFQFALDGCTLALPLPAPVVASVKGDQQPDGTGGQGKSGAPINPVVSGKPFIRFIFCTA